MNNNTMMKVILWLLVLFLVVFAGYQGYDYFYGDRYVTEEAYICEVSSSFLTRGIMLRSESRLDVAASGVVVYALDEGQKFKSTTVLANAYATQADAQTDIEVSKATAELDALMNIKSSINSSNVQDIEQLGRDISSSLRSFSYDVQRGVYDDIDGCRIELLEKLNRRMVLTEGESALDELIAELREVAASKGSSSKIRAGSSGYFSRYVDGQEESFGFDLLDTTDSSAIESLATQDYPYDYSAFGKAVKDYHWYYAATLPLSDAAAFRKGRKVELRFAGGSGAAVSGTVYSTVEDTANQKVIVYVRGETMNSDTIARRSASVELSFSSVKGIRFPAEALRIVDGVKGVYVDSGYSVSFRKVDIIYSGDGFYLSRQYTSKEDTAVYLSVFDKIIVEGSDLYAGKPLV